MLNAITKYSNFSKYFLILCLAPEASVFLFDSVCLCVCVCADV